MKIQDNNSQSNLMSEVLYMVLPLKSLCKKLYTPILTINNTHDTLKFILLYKNNHP